MTPANSHPLGPACANEHAHRQLPTKSALEQASTVQIQDRAGQEISFRSLLAGQAEGEKHLIVFIRHFFCGSCEQYVTALARGLPPASLGAAHTALTLIGCGDATCIPGYIERTACPYPVYTNPDASLYKALGMTYHTIRPGPTPEYITKGFWRNVWDSTWNALASGRPLSAGPAAQNGGEWLFQGGEVRWCNRMRGTQDHAEVKELKEVLGIQE